jgi:DNA adenine methylase
MNRQLNLFGEEVAGNDVINVASVPQRSPFRYPGGKTWLIPVVRRWLRQDRYPAQNLIEPFAGGGIVSLTAAFEKLAGHIVMVEKDEDIAAVWEVILNGENRRLAEKIISYRLSVENVRSELDNPDKQLHDVAFCTILRNRIFHGGIMAKGAGMTKNGENGKGILSRWYPKTLHDRIIAIGFVKDMISFISGDAFGVLEQYRNDRNAYFFIDPPYTVAGKRLYRYSEIDHERLFDITAKLKGKFMLTYDNAAEIRQLSEKYNLPYRLIPMKTTHHLRKEEIIICDNFSWW